MDSAAFRETNDGFRIAVNGLDGYQSRKTIRLTSILEANSLR